MLARVAELRDARPSAPFQGRPACSSRRPSAVRTCASTCRPIGPQTIAAAAAAQLQGVALAAGEVLIAEREAFARAADAAGLFVVGYAP